MRGSRAKQIRKAVYSEILGNADSHKRVAPDLSLEKAALYHAQRAVYLRAKKIYRRDGQATYPDLIRTVPSAVSFSAQAIVNKFTPKEEPDGSLHEGEQTDHNREG